MITMHILEYLKENGIGTTINDDLFFEYLPLDKYGLCIVSTSGLKKRGVRTNSQNFDIWCRHESSNVAAVEQLEAVVNLLAASYGTACALPTVDGYSDAIYSRVVFDPITNIENLGENSEGRVLFRIGATVTFNKET